MFEYLVLNFGGTIWEGVGIRGWLEEVCHLRWFGGFKRLIPLPVCSLSSGCRSRCEISYVLAAMSYSAITDSNPLENFSPVTLFILYAVLIIVFYHNNKVSKKEIDNMNGVFL